MEREGDGDTSCGWCTWNNSPKIGKGTGSLGNKRISAEHPEFFHHSNYKNDWHRYLILK